MEKTITWDLETSGLNPWYNNCITCICAKDSEGESFSWTIENHTEEILIKEFIMWIRDREHFTLITKNGKGFDIPFILSRVIQLGLHYEDYSFLLNMRHIDLHLITKKWISLDDMAKLLGVKSKIGTGLDAIKYYNEKSWEELKDYCMNDVRVTKEVYRKLKELGVLK